jgi:hypothetical protein
VSLAGIGSRSGLPDRIGQQSHPQDRLWVGSRETSIGFRGRSEMVVARA